MKKLCRTSWRSYERIRTVDAQTLRDERVKARLTQFGLQGLSGVSWRTISRIENGNVFANLTTVRALETALNVSLAPEDRGNVTD